ncbi:MAG: peptidoglycan DD-metalloendopeptidase family protein [Firmicutes bacterium]|nr:peptidoglycan DD-metalloendopeptidase family protein [Bacillota bacterium]
MKISKSFLCIIGIMILVFGSSVLLKESAGYEVSYEGTPVGFVEQPGEVLDNLDPIAITLSEKIRMQAAVTEEQFDFEKKRKVFRTKDGWQDVAAETGEKCRVDVNVYECRVNDQAVIRTNDIDRAGEAVQKIIEDYEAANPEEQFDRIGFAENVVFAVSRDKPVEEIPPEEMEQTLRDSLTVETVERKYEQTAIPYEVLYEETETRPLGEKSVKVNGVEGAKVTETTVVRHDGEEVSRTESEAVLTQPVSEVILVGTYAESIPWDGEEFMNPVNGVLTSKMGWRWGRIHKGIDIGAPMGEPVYASKGGVVTAAGYNEGGYGNMVEIDHGDGTWTLYAHLSAIDTEAGREVLAGELIGRVGSTGRSTGPHLHFEIIIDGVIADPLDYVRY